MTMILCSCWLLFFKPWLLRLPKESEKKASLEAFWLKNPMFWQWNCQFYRILFKEKRSIVKPQKASLHEMGVVSFGSVLMILAASHLHHQCYCYWTPKLNLFHSPVPSTRKNFSFRLIRIAMSGHRQCCEWQFNQKSVCFLHVWQVSTIQWKRKDIILYSLCKILCFSHIRQDISKIWNYFL